ncbi:MAG: Mobile element protein [uncultured Phycisphaerae bacterium]|uniref:Mobile element protein n=1 Tax=uncultured Phycisphaerae bacterium TaxID=904963 RepID=A0A6J4PHF5_9BACT|nr:MAG: Mobile element protein [uncultured Phycisphaerae bacterium]
MGFDSIIALDLGKFKSVCCLMDARARTHRFETVATTPAALHDLLVANAGPDPSRTVVVFETCDCAGWAHDLAAALGLQVRVANCCHESWKWRRVKRKTDKDDALKLARMVLLEQLPTVHVPPADQRQRRRLVQHRRSVVRRRTQCKNAVRSIFSQQGLTELLPRGNKAWTAAGVAQLRQHARPMGDCVELADLWRGRLHAELEILAAVDQQLRVLERKLDELAESDEKVKLLQTVPGVGPRLAEAVVLCLDDPRRFKSGAEVGGYAGLTPKLIESGQMSRVGRITRRGPSLLRGMLVEVAWVVWRKNAWAQAFVAKVSRGMKSRKKIAIVALARRLLVKLWAMLRTTTPWRDPGVAAAAAAT